MGNEYLTEPSKHKLGKSLFFYQFFGSCSNTHSSVQLRTGQEQGCAHFLFAFVRKLASKLFLLINYSEFNKSKPCHIYFVEH